MIKKLSYFILGAIIMVAGTVFAAPYFIFQKTILPEIDSSYDLGTSTKAWRNIYTDEICLAGDCQTAWPTGGGGSGGGTWSTTTTPVSGVLFNYPNNNDDVVLIGSNSSTTAEFYFDPNTLFAQFLGRLSFAHASGTALTLTGSAYLPKLGNLTSNGFVKTSGSDGTLSVDTNSYLTGSGAGVTAVSVASANGFTGSSSGGATPALTLTTSITGMLKGNGTAISAASNGTDFTLITAKTCTAGDFVSAVTAGGVFTCTTPAGTTYTGTYPVVVTGSVLSLAFGTTTSNTWGGTQSFTNTANFNTWTNSGSATTTNLAITALTGVLKGNGSTAPLSVASNGTDFTLISATTCGGTDKVSAISASGAVTCSTDQTSAGGSSAFEIATTSDIAVPGLSYFTKTSGRTTLGSVATTTVSCSGSTSCTSFVAIGGAPITISSSAGGGSGTVSTSTNEVAGRLSYWTSNSATPALLGQVSTTTLSLSGFPASIPNTLGTLVGGSNTTWTWWGLATTSQPSSSNLLVSNGGQGVYGVATSTPTVTAPITYSGTLGSFVGGVGGTFGCNTATGAVAGCLSTANWNTFNNKIGTSTTPTLGHIAYWGGTATTPALSSVATTSATCSGGISCSTFNVLGSSPITLSSFTYPFPSAATSTLLNFSGGLTLSGGTADFSAATVKQHVYQTFAYSTSTAWTATTTIALGVAFNAEQWSAVKCYTDVGTLNVSVYDGTNRMNMFNASTTIGTVILSTNNTFTASEKRYIDIGTPATSPTKISCTTDVIINN